MFIRNRSSTTNTVSLVILELIISTFFLFVLNILYVYLHTHYLFIYLQGFRTSSFLGSSFSHSCLSLLCCCFPFCLDCFLPPPPSPTSPLNPSGKIKRHAMVTYAFWLMNSRLTRYIKRMQIVWR